jgi:protein-tyrosine phosphatase
MFSFFKKKDNEKNFALDYGSVVVDMHSHVLPGIDDGAQNVEQSVELVKKMMELGIKKIIATPHIMIDYYRNTPQTIKDALDLLKAELKKQEINITIEAAAEHYFDETLEPRIDAHKALTMGNNYVLFEFSFMNKPSNWQTVVKKMKEKGYKPILAHPERYSYLSTDEMVEIRGMGCNLQMNTISLTGYYGKDVKKKAEQMVDLELVDFISSDMHHLRHAEALKLALKTTHLQKLLFAYPLKNVMLK